MFVIIKNISIPPLSIYPYTKTYKIIYHPYVSVNR